MRGPAARSTWRRARDQRRSYEFLRVLMSRVGSNPRPGSDQGGERQKQRESTELRVRRSDRASLVRKHAYIQLFTQESGVERERDVRGANSSGSSASLASVCAS